MYYPGESKLSKITFLIILSFILLSSADIADRPSINESENQDNVIKVSLDDAVALALERNRQILTSMENAESSKWSVEAAEAQFNIKVTPQINIGLSGSQGYSAGTGGGLNISKQLAIGTRISASASLNKSDLGYANHLNLSISQPLFRGFSRDYNMRAVDSAKLAGKNAQRNLYYTRVRVVLQTISSYFNILRLKDTIKLTSDSLDRLKKHEKLVELKNNTGFASPVEVLRVKLQIKQMEDTLIQSEQAYKDSMDQLKFILNIPAELNIDTVPVPDTERIMFNTEESIRIAFKERIELAMLGDQLDEAEKLIGINKNQLLPSVDLVLNYRTFGSNPEFSDLKWLDNDMLDIGLNTNLNLDRTDEMVTYFKSKLYKSQLLRDLEQKKVEIINEVNQKIRTVNRNYELIELNKTKLKDARGKYELSRLKFMHEMANNFDLIESEDQLRSAEASLMNAKISYLMSIYEFRSSIGTLLEKTGDL